MIYYDQNGHRKQLMDTAAMIVFENNDYILSFDHQTKFLSMMVKNDVSLTDVVIARFVLGAYPKIDNSGNYTYSLRLLKNHKSINGVDYSLKTLFKQFLSFYGIKCKITVSRRFGCLYDYAFKVSSIDNAKLLIFVNPLGEYVYDN